MDVLKEASTNGLFGVATTSARNNWYHVVLYKDKLKAFYAIDIAKEKWLFIIRIMMTYEDIKLSDGGFDSCVYCGMHYDGYTERCFNTCPLKANKNCCLYANSTYDKWLQNRSIETAQNMLQAIIDAG